MAKRTPEKLSTRMVVTPPTLPDSLEGRNSSDAKSQSAYVLMAILTAEGKLIAADVVRSGDFQQPDNELLQSFADASRAFISNRHSNKQIQKSNIHLIGNYSSNSPGFPQEDYYAALELAFAKIDAENINYCHIEWGTVELRLLTFHDKQWQPSQVSNNELLIRLPELPRNVSPTEAAQRTLEALDQLIVPLREQWASYERTHGRALNETKYPEVARVRAAIQPSEEQVRTQEDKILSTTASTKQIVDKAYTIVQDSLRPRTFRLKIARKLNQCIERFNRLDSKETEAGVKKQLVDAINLAKRTLRLESRLTKSLKELTKGTSVGISFRSSSVSQKTGRFVVQQTSTPERKSANLTRVLPITLVLTDE
ncbi:MAG: hypothetical protein SFX18_17660 [Pirellulales bacterium]|nr:hypothetical protein [Pirellulales bacterium]